MEATQLMSFGDVRRTILDTVADVRNGKIKAGDAMVVAALFKTLNDNVQVEINAAKMSIATEGKAHAFGRVVGMGQRLIGNDKSQIS